MMTRYLHEVLPGFSNPKGGDFGLFNRNLLGPHRLDNFPVVGIREKESLGIGNRLPAEKYFVSSSGAEDVYTGAEWVTGCRTVGEISEVMVTDHVWLGDQNSFMGFAAICISPAAWRRLQSGELEKELPRHLRERNAGNRNLSKCLDLSRALVESFLKDNQDPWREGFTLGDEEMLRLSHFTTMHYKNGWGWDGTDRAVWPHDWVLAIDRDGWLWCRQFEEGDTLTQPDPCFVDSVWVREDHQDFWVKTVGRNPN